MRRSRVLWKNSDIQEAVRKQLATVSNIMGEVGARTRAVEYKPRDVKSLETAGLITDTTEAVSMGR